MFQVIAVHHAVPEHRDAFLAFCHRVIDAAKDADGCLEFTVWGAPDGPTLYGFSRWESPEHFQAALPTIMSLAPDRKSEWSSAPDDVIPMVLRTPE